MGLFGSLAFVALAELISFCARVAVKLVVLGRGFEGLEAAVLEIDCWIDVGSLAFKVDLGSLVATNVLDVSGDTTGRFFVVRCASVI